MTIKMAECPFKWTCINGSSDGIDEVEMLPCAFSNLVQVLEYFDCSFVYLDSKRD